MPGHAIVGGGTSGAGLAVGRRLAAEGWAVTALSHDRAAVKRLSTEPGAAIHLTYADIRSSADVEAAVAEAVDRSGPPSALVNCAAIRRTGTVLSTSEQEWDEVLDTNLKGTFLLSRAVLPSMVANGGGSIVNFASISAHGAGANVAYACSKAGVLTLTRCMAFDHARQRIRVNAIVAGPIASSPEISSGMFEAFAAHIPDLADRLRTMTVTGRLPTPEEYARVVGFLVCDAAELISGACLDVGTLPGMFTDDTALMARD